MSADELDELLTDEELELVLELELLEGGADDEELEDEDEGGLLDELDEDDGGLDELLELDELTLLEVLDDEELLEIDELLELEEGGLIEELEELLEEELR